MLEAAENGVEPGAIRAGVLLRLAGIVWTDVNRCSEPLEQRRARPKYSIIS